MDRKKRSQFEVKESFDENFTGNLCCDGILFCDRLWLVWWVTHHPLAAVPDRTSRSRVPPFHKDIRSTVEVAFDGFCSNAVQRDAVVEVAK